MNARWTGHYMVTASGKKGVYRHKNLRSKMVLKRKVNATQIRRYREYLNIGRTGTTKRDSPYNLSVREGTARSKETPIPTRSECYIKEYEKAGTKSE